MTDAADREATPFRAVRDLAGAPVADAGGRPIGAIYGALAEADTGLIRYFDLALDEHGRHVLVPIGHARVHEPEGEPALRLRAAVLDDLLEIPVYEGTPPDPESERALLNAHGQCFYGEHYYAHPAYDHTGLYAGGRPVIATAQTAAGLAPLGQLHDIRLAEDDTDPRGWALEADGVLGTIEELMVDVAAGVARYLVIRRVSDDRTVLLPVGFVRVDPEARRARAPGILPGDLDALPAYAGGPVDRPYEEAVRTTLLGRLVPARRHVLPDFREQTA